MHPLYTYVPPQLAAFVDSRFPSVRNTVIPGFRYSFTGTGSNPHLAYKGRNRSIDCSSDDGQGDLACGTSLNLRNFTVMCWFLSSASKSNHYLLQRADDSAAWHFRLYVASGGLYLLHLGGGGGLKQAGSISPTVQDSLWHHCAGVRRYNDYVRTYVDGAETSSAADDTYTPDPGTAINIGRRTVNDTDAARGYISNVMVFNRPLPLREIKMYAKGWLPPLRRGYTTGKLVAPSAKPWLYRRSSIVSKPYLQVA